MTSAASTTTAVDWRRVGLFYGVAFGGAVGVALVIWGLQQILGELAATATVALTALLYMPLPLVAGLIVERAGRRRPLIAADWASLRSSFWRTYGRNAAIAVLVILAVIAIGLAASWLVGWVQVPGAGHFVSSEGELRERMQQIAPTMDPQAQIPSLFVLSVMTGVQGILAGLTINGLFAYGEEYGWRGVLAAELRPLGLFRANLLTGLLWGLWHAPIIMLGHNYGAEWGWGILAMITWVTPLAFLLSWVRERTGSVLSAAILHGAYNGVVGVFLFTTIGGSVLISVPMGLVMAVALTVLAIIAWRWFPPHQSIDPAGIQFADGSRL